MVELAAQGENGTISVITQMQKQGDQLILKGTHIDGGGKDTSSISALKDLARDLGRQQGATAARVKEISEALSRVGLEERYSQLDPSSVDFKNVYLAEQHLEEGVVSLQGFFDDLRSFYSESTKENMAIVSYLA